MEYITFFTPSYPHFSLAGSALYRPGDSHRKRTSIGVFDLIFIKYGELFISDRDTKYHLKQNDILILDPNSTHYSYREVSTETLFLWIHFIPCSEFVFSNKITLKNVKNKCHNIYTRNEHQLILPTYKKLDNLKATKFVTLFSNLTSLSIDKYLQKQKESTNTLSPLEQQTIFLEILSLIQVVPYSKDSSNSLAVSVMEYLSENYSQPLSLEDISNHFNYHPGHIIRAMKSELETTPNQALVNIRIYNAKKLLTNTSLTCKKIATSVGFTSTSYFSKTFKEYTDMTPTEYRNSLEKKKVTGDTPNDYR